MHACMLSHFIHGRLFATPGTVAHQAPLSMEFSRQEYWSGLRFPPPGDLPNPGIEPRSPASQVGSSALSHLGSPIPLMSLLQIVHREWINVLAGNSIMRPGHELLLFKDYVGDYSFKFKLDTSRINPRIPDTQPTWTGLSRSPHPPAPDGSSICRARTLAGMWPKGF